MFHSNNLIIMGNMTILISILQTLTIINVLIEPFNENLKFYHYQN